jgi:hypothetical protein
VEIGDDSTRRRLFDATGNAADDVMVLIPVEIYWRTLFSAILPGLI